MRQAGVVVDVPARSLSSAFDYGLPEGLIDEVLVGTPVLVPFGPRTVVGYVVSVSDRQPGRDLRDILAVLGRPLFGSHVPEVASWMAHHYACGLADALRPFLPPGGTPKARRTAEGYVLERPAAGPVDDRWVELTKDADVSRVRRGAVRQRAVLDSLAGGPVRMAELRADLGSVSGAVARLSEIGLVEVVERRLWRRPSFGEVRSSPAHALNEEQDKALRAIRDASPGTAVLLDGVTGSGKTEVYLAALEDVVASGGRGIVLVPEISLTPQTVGRFRARFGDAVAVVHSRLSAGERYDQWDIARTGEASVVVGPRSALFAPVEHLRIIVVDEEHDASYKQNSSPRYHARDVASRLCHATGAVLVLGSATPSLESREASVHGVITRLVLSARATGVQMPRVQIVDMAREFEEGNRSMLSRPLREELAGVAARREKAIVFLNRRGFASFLLCRECGHVPSCDSCSVSMTYHETGQRLACHHCGAVRAVPARCPECSSPYLRQFGAGTQRVQSELEKVFPDLPLVRMDADTTRGKGGHEARLAEFEGLDAGVLLGTQMIAKGLDYPEVTLVGVLSADLGLRLPDFRSGERTYQLMEQVSGRAGRAGSVGRVVLQTYWPDHPAIRAAAAHDPELFYRAERESRRELGYPPFGTLARVLITGRSVPDVNRAASAIAESLRRSVEELDASVLGPAPAPIERVRGSHRWHVVLKGSVDLDTGPVVREALEVAGPLPDGVSAVPDVDPQDML